MYNNKRKNYSVQPIAGMMYKTKYASLRVFLSDNFNPVNGLDIHIDLNSFINAMSTSSKFLQSIPFAGDAVEEDIIVAIFSVLKHWKDWSRMLHVDTRVFLDMNDFEMYMMPEQDIIKSYLLPYVNKFTKDDGLSSLTYYLNEALKKIDAVLKYVPGIYLIRNNRFDSYVNPIIMDEDNNREKIIVTGNTLMTSYMIENKCHVIFSKFKHQIVDPVMIVQSISKIDNDIMNTFIRNRVFYSLLNAVIGDYDRGLIGVTQLGISSFANDLLRAVERGDIPNDPKDIHSVLPIINKSYHDYITKAYPLVNVVTHKEMIPQSLIEKLKSTMIDIYDIDQLQGLSVGGFYPMDLL